jgi:hypothetical protein
MCRIEVMLQLDIFILIHLYLNQALVEIVIATLIRLCWNKRKNQMQPTWVHIVGRYF